MTTQDKNIENKTATGSENDARKKYNAMKPVMVKTNPALYAKEETNFMQKLFDFAKNYFGTYKNNDRNMDGIIYNKGSIRSIQRHAQGNIKYDLLPYIPEIIRHGIYLDTLPKTDKLDSHLFVAKVRVNLENRFEDKAVGFIVREDANGKRYYSHTITKKIDAMAESENSVLHIGATKQPSASDPIPNILKKHLGVNRKQ